MARKLKSDKVLFLAVLFLVCVSAVMVCSASAAAALQRNWDLTRFLFKQTTWVVVGFLLMAVTMRIHYRGYQQPFVIWSGLGIVAVVAGPGAVDRAGDQRQPALVPDWRRRHPAVGAGQAGGGDLHRRPAGAAHGAGQRAGGVIVPAGLVVGTLSALILLQPDLGTAVFLVLVSGVLIFAAGMSYGYLAALAGVVDRRCGADLAARRVPVGAA